MDAALLAKVTEIQDRVNARVAQELEAAEREWLNWVATSPARIAPPLVAQPPKAEDFTSQVDVAQLFAPFVNLPATPSIVAIADEVGAARHHLSDAQVDMLSQLVANSANWTGCAGDGFNRFASSLNHANFEHITLLDELHRLFGAYVQLIEATRAAAHELADQTIAGLQNLGPVYSLDWRALLEVAIAVAVIVGTEGSGAALLIIQAANVAEFGLAGRDLLQGVAIGGSPVRAFMDSVGAAGERLAAGARAKADVLAGLFNSVPDLLEANRAVVMPVAPTHPVDFVMQS